MMTANRLRIVCALALVASAAAPAAAQTRPKRNALALGFQVEDHGDGQSTQTETTATLTHYVNRRLEVNFGVDQHNRYDDLDTQLQAGAGYAFAEGKFRLAGSLGVGLGADTVARREYTLKSEAVVWPHASPIFEYKRSVYTDTISVTVLTLGSKLSRGRWSGQAAYQNTRAPHLDKVGHAVGIETSTRLTHRVSLIGNAGYGAEHRHSRTVVEAGRALQSLTLEVGPAVRLSPAHSLQATYTFEDKRTRYHVSGLNLTGTFGF